MLVLTIKLAFVGNSGRGHVERERGLTHGRTRSQNIRSDGCTAPIISRSVRPVGGPETSMAVEQIKEDLDTFFLNRAKLASGGTAQQNIENLLLGCLEQRLRIHGSAASSEISALVRIKRRSSDVSCTIFAWCSTYRER